ncbi:acyltransferase domain-containing protein [Streptomyces sp. NPDC047928]|uniref:acyltransferase domain-containing protein n=1 Tax=unclassified Streptomyces TaxID=2593676 RepID=UPI003722675F
MNRPVNHPVNRPLDTAVTAVTAAPAAPAAPAGLAVQAGPSGPPPVLLLFPGQGSQHARMAVGLYGHDAAFTDAMDAAFAAFDASGASGACGAYGVSGAKCPAVGEALRADWLTDRPAVPLDHVTRSQPLLFAVGHALGRMLLEHGVRPWALLGHSVGELAAATLAGVFSLEAAAGLLLDRVDRLASAPPGGMLAVAATAEALRPFVTDEVVVAAVNAPRQTILAGPRDPLAAVARALRDAGLTCRPVPSLTAFHSPSLGAATAGSFDRFAATPVAAPRIPLHSGYRAEPLTAQLAADPSYWASHPVEPVRFWPALDALLGGGRDGTVCVEAGPGQGLSTIARQHPTVRAGRGTVVPLLPPRPGPPEADRDAVAAALTALRDRGAVPDREALRGHSAPPGGAAVPGPGERLAPQRGSA